MAPDSRCTAAPPMASGESEPAVLAARSQALGPVVRVSCERLARVLFAEIVRLDREYPIVGLTCRPGRRDPAMPVERVRERIWPTVPIYVIEPRESRTINDLLPKDLGAYNGAARVWWPGVDAECEPSWHPLIYDSSKRYGEGALARIAAEFAKVPESISDLSPREQTATRLRSVPRPAAASVKQASAPVVLLAARNDLRRLTSDLRRTDRDYPIVVLTLGERDEAPVFPPSLICPALDPHVPVYVLGSPDLCRRLGHALDPQLAVHGGDARIFWPGVNRDSDPADHPLVPARSTGDRRAPANRLIAALDLSRPGVRGHVAVAQERIQTVEQRAADTLRALRDARSERDTALERAEVAETGLAALEQRLRMLQEAGLDLDELEAVAEMDQEAIMQRLICREWLTSLAAADRCEKYLLGGYRFAPEFLGSVEDRRIATPRARIAFACAMVACGRAAELPGLEPHPWREGKLSGSGDDPQAVRADGGKGLMCNLGHGRGAARLFYWLLPDGKVEFDSVRNHDAIGERA